jgi:hypothetical protein
MWNDVKGDRTHLYSWFWVNVLEHPKIGHDRMEIWVEAGDEVMEAEMETEISGDGWTEKRASGLQDNGNDCRESKAFNSSADEEAAGVGATETEVVVEIDPATESVVELSFGVI